MTFKELREKANKSLEESASELNIKKTTLRKYELAIRTPSSFVLMNMKYIYNCSGDELIQALYTNFQKRRCVYGSKQK